MKDSIEDKWDWSKTHPVIHLSFDAITMREIGLDKKVVGIGVNFELAAKSITGWMVEELSL